MVEFCVKREVFVCIALLFKIYFFGFLRKSTIYLFGFLCFLAIYLFG